MLVPDVKVKEAVGYLKIKGTLRYLRCLRHTWSCAMETSLAPKSCCPLLHTLTEMTLWEMHPFYVKLSLCLIWKDPPVDLTGLEKLSLLCPWYFSLFLQLLTATEPVLCRISSSRRQHSRTACCTGNTVFLVACVTSRAPSPCSPHASSIAVLQLELSSVPLCLISWQGFRNMGLVLEQEHFKVP